MLVVCICKCFAWFYGEKGIRTLEVKNLHTFQMCSLVHSDTSPIFVSNNYIPFFNKINETIYKNNINIIIAINEFPITRSETPKIPYLKVFTI